MNIFNVIELIGTVAFSVSGAVVAIEKKMDILGVMILGLTTACGGGIIRDMIIGVHPASTFQNPVYAITAMVTALIFFVPAVRKKFHSHSKGYDYVLLLMDSAGLGIFTVVGVKAGLNVEMTSVFLQVFLGTVTGVGGGILRDMMAGTTPMIFVKHFYASASIIGALFSALVWHDLGDVPTMILGSLVVFVLRLLAARYQWNLPVSEEE